MSNVNDKLEYGSQTYQGDGIMSASAVLADSLTMESLSADTLTAVVRDTRLETRLLAAGGRLVAAQGFGGTGIVGIARTLLTAKGDRYGLNRYNYGDVVRYYHDDTLITKQYVETITRTGREQWKLPLRRHLHRRDPGGAGGGHHPRHYPVHPGRGPWSHAHVWLAS